MPNPIFFNQLLISMNLYRHAKNQVFSSLCSRDIDDLKFLYCDWLSAFWPISPKPDFSQIWYLCKNTVNNINFRYRPNSVKNNDQIFQSIQKALFLAHFRPIFPISRAQQNFPGKSGSVTYNFTWDSSTMPKFRKN